MYEPQSAHCISISDGMRSNATAPGLYIVSPEFIPETENETDVCMSLFLSSNGGVYTYLSLVDDNNDVMESEWYLLSYPSKWRVSWEFQVAPDEFYNVLIDVYSTLTYYRYSVVHNVSMESGPCDFIGNHSQVTAYIYIIV